MTKAKDEPASTPEHYETSAVYSECPKCKANLWQGPFTRGKIINGVLEATENIYQCRNCHSEFELTDMTQRAVGS